MAHTTNLEALESPYLDPSRRDAVTRETGSERASLAVGESPFAALDAAALETQRAAEDELDHEHAGPDLEEEVLTLPTASPALPGDVTLRAQLFAMGARARAMHTAFGAFGDPARLASLLPPALNEAFEPFTGPQNRFKVHVARLGAEAFLFDTRVEKTGKYGSFVDHPEDLDAGFEAADKRNFVHFSIRRLHGVSLIVVKPATHRRQMSCAIALLRALQAELGQRRFFTTGDTQLLLDYRTLVVQILWRHYQGLQDAVLDAAAKAPLNWTQVAKAWHADLDLAAISQRIDDADTVLPTFRLTTNTYRDYFKPAPATDLGFTHYTPTPPAATGPGPQTPYRLVVLRRAEQRAFIERLRLERPAEALPRLHDDESWQRWVRATWDAPKLRREYKWQAILEHVSGYFKAFTIHAPHDIREGCSVPSYLTRKFPRAVTGALVHDCFVYAARWLHILGRLFTPGSMPADLANPRLFLIEMPAHVGVMIRVNWTTLPQPVTIGINNKDATLFDFDARESNEVIARAVVKDMYEGMRTPFVVRPIAAKPMSAEALWKELCKLAERQLRLPYADTTLPPHLRYLGYNATVARISTDLTNAVLASWISMHQRLSSAQGAGRQVPAGRISDEIRQHAANFEKALKLAIAEFGRQTQPLIKEIHDDLAANKGRVPAGVLFAESSPSLPFVSAANGYREALRRAVQSRDLASIEPLAFFSADDFAAIVQ